MNNILNNGEETRQLILIQAAENSFIRPLEAQGWDTKIEAEIGKGQFLFISTNRGNDHHRVAFLYSSATDNSVYKSLSREADHIFFNGEPYKLESFAYGINVPVEPANKFHETLFKWNESQSSQVSRPEKEKDMYENTPPQNLRLLSENPIEAIWLRIRPLQSVALAKKLILSRCKSENIDLEDNVINGKAESLSYSLRNATDYFHTAKSYNLSQRIVNLYYGSLSFAFADMLSSPSGIHEISDIEKHTKCGHGLYTLDNPDCPSGNIITGIISSGFFPQWLKFMNLPVTDIPAKKARSYDEIKSMPKTSWITLEQLFGSIPEISDIFNQALDGPPRYVKPSFDTSGANPSNRSKSFGKTYVLLTDDSGRIKEENIQEFSNLISEISAVSPNLSGKFRVAIKHPEEQHWFKAINIHRSSFTTGDLILPIFGIVNDYKAICITLLYTLSIIVRYRPSVWRRIQEGDLDYLRVLIEAFLQIVERVLPEKFLEKITGQVLSAKQPGSLF